MSDNQGSESTLDAKLAVLPLSVDYPCNYLEDRVARQQQLYWPREWGPLAAAFYEQLMNRGFRRSGRLFYRPRCIGCRKCIPIRVDVETFRPSESQRKVLKRNADVQVRWQAPQIDAARVALYDRYTRSRHTETDGDDEGRVPVAEALERFLYDSPTETLEAAYYVGERLIGVGLCDVTPNVLSTVYFYFDPDEAKRSLGVFSALEEIAWARRAERSHYYLGYWIEGCRKMDYKAALSAHELLLPDGGRGAGPGWVPQPRRKLP